MIWPDRPAAQFWAEVAVATLAFCVFCLFVFGHPGIYADTDSYLAVGQTLAAALHLTPADAAATTLQGSAQQSAALETQKHLAMTIAGARLPLYGVLLLIPVALGSGFWLVGLQALAAALTVVITVQAMLGAGRPWISIAVLALVSSLPVFVGYLMPDIFGALAFLSIVTLVVWYEGLSWPRRLYLAAMIAVGVLVHLSNGAVLLLVLPLILLVGLAGRVASWRGAAPGVLLSVTALAVAMLGNFAYPLAVRVVRHEPIYSPPFLTARLIADGPGRTYLAKACAADPQRFALCRFDVSHAANENQFLWSKDPAVGVFELGDYATRVRLVHEQPAFVMGVITHEPMGVLAAAVRNFSSLLVNVRLDDVIGDPAYFLRDQRYTVFKRLLTGTSHCLEPGKSCAPTVLLPVANIVTAVVLWLSFLVLAFNIPWLVKSDRRMGVWVAGIVGIFVINAAICGVLSAPSARYAARSAWIVPLAAVLVVQRRRKPAGPVAA